ncbi:PatA/PatG family cyanobactin maturation protease [Pleurocapsa sp. PCC 7319]|uniref:S8 family peptidase n=1 Tax=Pleurocapsa sp. PCC 7319 TaxID=118161 RepID=UPI00034B5426|nr:PatA/PatG family cyanobactin maturation protease [Pleurocapsa sp. PCC 7319]
MFDLTKLPGIQQLWSKTKGDPKICVAILDGLVDQTHPCFEGANLARLPTLVEGEASLDGTMSTHGTHVTSIIFGQPNSALPGIAPKCKGSIVPVFSDRQRSLSQLDLARAIEQAVSAGADIINISGGQLTDDGEAEDWLKRAVRLCQENNVLIVAAAGNDGCECLHVPAALPAVLAVGAMDGLGQPLEISNWGKTYQSQGILAPGENILGAKPGGGTVRLSGTSFATPIVTGVAALLLSLQHQYGEIDPQQVRTALLKTALPCDFSLKNDHQRCLVGKLDIFSALKYLTGEIMTKELQTIEASGCGCGGNDNTSTEVLANTAVSNELETESKQTVVSNSEDREVKSSELVTASAAETMYTSNTSADRTTSMPTQSANFVNASQAPSNISEVNLVYALGTLGYDFGSEARRDSFKQFMSGVAIEPGILVPANPYDARQMVDYLGENLSEAKSLIWTLNMELTPIYAIEPVGTFARDVYEVFQEFLSGQVQAEDNDEYIERVSIPGRITGRTVRLFSGQIVPVIEPESPRGMYGWKVNTLVGSALEAVRTQEGDVDEQQMRRSLGSFLNRVYYDLRNLGQTSQDRALNFAATNAFQAASTFSEAVATGMELDSINVQKSPFCRLDSDCWDVQLKFFDPENSRRAKKVFRFTIDVSDLVPVTLGEVRSWSTPY